MVDATRRSVLHALSATLPVLGGCQTVTESDESTPSDPSPSTSASDAARIEVPDRPVLQDEVVAPRLSGFDPDTEVTVWAIARQGSTVESYATVRTDERGVANLADATPVEGTWDGDGEMGFVTSMRRTRNLDRVHTFEDVSLDTGRPHEERVGLAAVVDGESVATATLRRRTMADSATRTPVDRDGLVGWLYRPDDGDPRPGVVVLHGGGGRPLHPVGGMLASRGFAALVVQYFGDPDPIPDRQVEVPLGYVGDAVDWFAGHGAVAGERVGLVGWSLGGQLALLAGTRFDRVGAVASYAASTVVSLFDTFGGSPWTEDGEPLPYVSVPTDAFERTQDGVATRPAFEAGVERANPDRLARATIPVEEIGRPVLLVSGGDDRVVPAGSQADRAVDRFEANGRRDDVTHCHYPDAGHRIAIPYGPAGPRRRGDRRVFGGTVEGIARADADSWPRLRSFFAGALDR